MGKRVKRSHFKKPSTMHRNQANFDMRFNEVCFYRVINGKCIPNCQWLPNCELKDGKVHKVVI